MVYTIYDGPRLAPNGMYYWAYAAWHNAGDRAANRGAVELDTPRGLIRCDLANDHFGQFQPEYTRLKLDRDGKATRISDGAKIPVDQITNAADFETETVKVSIESQVAAATASRLAIATQRGERGRKILPVDTERPEKVDAYVNRMEAKRRPSR